MRPPRPGARTQHGPDQGVVEAAQRGGGRGQPHGADGRGRPRGGEQVQVGPQPAGQVDERGERTGSTSRVRRSRTATPSSDPSRTSRLIAAPPASASRVLTWHRRRHRGGAAPGPAARQARVRSRRSSSPARARSCSRGRPGSVSRTRARTRRSSCDQPSATGSRDGVTRGRRWLRPRLSLPQPSTWPRCPPAGPAPPPAREICWACTATATRSSRLPRPARAGAGPPWPGAGPGRRPRPAPGLRDSGPDLQRPDAVEHPVATTEPAGGTEHGAGVARASLPHVRLGREQA